MSYGYFQHMVRENPDRYPQRMGLLWNESESQMLITNLKLGKSIERIAEEHQRTAGSINARRKRIVEDMNSKGKTLQQIKEVTRFSTAEIEYHISRKKLKEENDNKLTELTESFPSFGKKELETISQRVAEIIKNEIIFKLTKRVEELEKLLDIETQTPSKSLNDTTMYDVWDSDEE